MHSIYTGPLWCHIVIWCKVAIKEEHCRVTLHHVTMSSDISVARCHGVKWHRNARSQCRATTVTPTPLKHQFHHPRLRATAPKCQELALSMLCICHLEGYIVSANYLLGMLQQLGNSQPRWCLLLIERNALCGGEGKARLDWLSHCIVPPQLKGGMQKSFFYPEKRQSNILNRNDVNVSMLHHIGKSVEPN